MNDALIIEGKQYISSRRAAEIAGYSNDYVGQLCRSGKLACKMIGRFWYVDETSLRAHKKESTRPNQTTFKKTDFASVPLKEVSKKDFKKFPDAGNPIAHSQKITTGAFKAFDQNLSAVGNSKSPEIVLEKAAPQISFDAPVPLSKNLPQPIPPLPWKMTVIPGKMPIDASYAEALFSNSKLFSDSALESDQHKPFSSVVAVPHVAVSSWASIVVLTAVALVLCLGGFTMNRLASFAANSLNASIGATVAFSENSADATASAVGSIGNDIGSIGQGILWGAEYVAFATGSLFKHSHQLAQNTIPPNESNAAFNANTPEPSAQSVIPPDEDGSVTAENGGLVVLPEPHVDQSGNTDDQDIAQDNSSDNASQAQTSSAAQSAANSKLESSIENSFSDPVVVTPSADGTSGVIQPVFRTVQGHDFLYVLVPVKATTTAPAQN